MHKKGASKPCACTTEKPVNIRGTPIIARCTHLGDGKVEAGGHEGDGVVLGQGPAHELAAFECVVCFRVCKTLYVRACCLVMREMALSSVRGLPMNSLRAICRAV